jgi:pyruvate-ferredoxin/flavodoxin oxidoreductase
MDAVKAFRDKALNPEHPTLRNTVQNPDVYFQFREANNRFYDDLPDTVEYYMDKINELTGADTSRSTTTRQDAERVIIAMGSVSGTIMDTVDYLNSAAKKSVSCRCIFTGRFCEAASRGCARVCKKIAVLDRCKEMGAVASRFMRTSAPPISKRPSAP